MKINDGKNQALALLKDLELPFPLEEKISKAIDDYKTGLHNS